MKLWIDDFHAPPEYFKYDDETGRPYEQVLWAKTSAEAFAIIKAHKDRLVEISFDHDLGDGDNTVAIADMLDEGAHDGTLDRIRWKVHSANSVGRKRLIAALQSADRFWDKAEAEFE